MTLRARVRWLSGHPEFLMKLKGNWLEATARLDLPTNLGTLGHKKLDQILLPRARGKPGQSHGQSVA